MATSHFLNQCSLPINEVLWHSPESNFTASGQATILSWVIVGALTALLRCYFLLFFRDSSSESGSTVILEPPPPPPVYPGDAFLNDLELSTTNRPRPHRMPLQNYVEALLESNRRPPISDTSDFSDSNTTHGSGADDKPHHYYKFFMVPCNYIKIRFDRLALLALLDR